MIDVIGVPVDSVGRSGGTERAPSVLRELDLLNAIAVAVRELGHSVRDLGDLSVSIRGEMRDVNTGVLAWAGVAETSLAVKAAVAESLTSGAVPLVVGGCCVIEPAATSAARSVLGRVGLVHLDGHLDLYDGDSSPTGEAADMPLSVVLGYGPPAWVELLDGASVEPGDCAAIGFHDPDEIAAGYAARAAAAGLLLIDAHGTSTGPTDLGSRLASRPDRPVWVHFDVDVLDGQVFPATDYPMSGGLTWEEVRAATVAVASKHQILGVTLACYNPEKDPGKKCGERLVTVMADVMAAVVGSPGSPSK